MPATGQLIGAAVAFVWLGMVLAISFLETPLKFRAPGITVPLGLGIGRLVFRALNTVEVVLAAALITSLLTHHPRRRGMDPSCRHGGTGWPPRRCCCGRVWTDEPKRSSPVTHRPPRGST